MAPHNRDPKLPQAGVSRRLQKCYQTPTVVEGGDEGLVSLVLPSSRVSTRTLCTHLRPGGGSVGGFAFFGPLLVWCPPPSQHACVVFPEYEYNPKPTGEGTSTWSKAASEWATLAGQQREVFYVDGENISYAGTFICHAGPRGVNAAKMGGPINDVRLLLPSFRSGLL